MARYSQGVYKPVNPEKYIGNGYPVYRSSWEKRVFIWLDKQPNVNKWASEAVKIPYKHPISGKINNYIPDLLVEYVDKNGISKVELIEIKPITQTLVEYAKSKKDIISLAINQAKWESATHWAKRQGVTFRVLTEKDIFGNPSIKGKKKK